MIRRTLPLLAALALAAPAAAQDPAPAERKKGPLPPGPWKYGLVGALNFSQSAFSDNWAGGDRGTINWVLSADLDAKRQLSRKFNWSNLLQLSYGQTSTQETSASSPTEKTWSRPDKTTDLILFESVGRFTLNSFVDPYVALRLDSQFIDESDPVGDLLFNPVKLTETAGVARVIDQGEDHELITRLGFGFRQNFARTFTDLTGDETESFSTNDGGLEFQTTAKYPLAEKRVLYQGKLLVFLPVFFSKSDALEDFDALAATFDPAREEVADFWKTADVNWQNTFSAEITKWLNVNLYAQLVYDKFDSATKIAPEGVTDAASFQAAARQIDGGVRKSGQFKQTLGIGLSYKFI